MIRYNMINLSSLGYHKVHMQYNNHKYNYVNFEDQFIFFDKIIELYAT